MSFYQAGMDAVGRTIAAVDQEIQAAPTPNAQAKLMLDRKRPTFYTKFDFDKAESCLRAMLLK